MWGGVYSLLAQQLPTCIHKISALHTVYVACTFSGYNCVYSYIRMYIPYSPSEVVSHRLTYYVLLKVAVLTLKFSGVFTVRLLSVRDSELASGPSSKVESPFKLLIVTAAQDNS